MLPAPKFTECIVSDSCCSFYKERKNARTHCHLLIQRLQSSCTSCFLSSPKLKRIHIYSLHNAVWSLYERWSNMSVSSLIWTATATIRFQRYVMLVWFCKCWNALHFYNLPVFCHLLIWWTPTNLALRSWGELWVTCARAPSTRSRYSCHRSETAFNIKCHLVCIIPLWADTFVNFWSSHCLIGKVVPFVS